MKQSSAITGIVIFLEVVAVCCLTRIACFKKKEDSHVLPEGMVVPWEKKYFLECDYKACMAFLRQLRDSRL